MGSMKLDWRSAPENFDRSVDRFFTAAFGPSASLYRRISWCGWRLSWAHPGTPMETRPEPVAALGSLGINVYETDERMTIEVALTMIKEETLHLAISGKKLVIRGERILASRRRATFPLPARGGAWFQQLIPLPASVSCGGFRAQLKGDTVRIEFTKQGRPPL